MTAIRIETEVDSEALYLPLLKPFVGKNVEITVRAIHEEIPPSEDSSWVSPLAGSVLEFIEPFESAIPLNEWEASR